MKLRNRLLPTMILIVLSWLMVGCFTIPFWERQKWGSHQPDFREMVGPAGSDKPIRPGQINKSQVVRLLGTPVMTSSDGRYLVFPLETVTGLRVMPLCFAAVASDAHVYALQLQFDQNDRLIRFQIFQRDREINTFIGYSDFTFREAFGELYVHPPEPGPAEAMQTRPSSTRPTTQHAVP